MKSNNRQQTNQQRSNEEVQQSNPEQVKEITEAQRDGIRYDYTDSSDFK
ncbi:hypothetical protein M3226_20010 [Neobacillus cucumis]|nr:hypothetical protein [Neobacillus cucumis]MCM3727936.1 hypothetical protein [Neobacillus cucumis]